MNVFDLACWANELLEISGFEENSINGIQVASEGTINMVATAVSASLETIEKCVELRAQALLVHHGILMKNNLQPLVGVQRKKIKLLIENNIALLAYHLPLDAHRQIGNNWKAAQDLGLSNMRPFCEYNKKWIGVIGFMKPIPFDEFAKRAEVYYGRSAVVVPAKKMIESVAIVSGGADRFLGDAAREGADCYITGRFDEPVWDMAREENISFVGLGHYATETIGVKALAEKIELDLGLTATFIRTDNPF